MGQAFADIRVHLRLILSYWIPGRTIDRRHFLDQPRSSTTGLLVQECLLVELKAVRALDDVHRVQCINYLRATGMPLCLLMDFSHPAWNSGVSS